MYIYGSRFSTCRTKQKSKRAASSTLPSPVSDLAQQTHFGLLLGHLIYSGFSDGAQQPAPCLVLFLRTARSNGSSLLKDTSAIERHA
jgi:hypothetical protein